MVVSTGQEVWQVYGMEGELEAEYAANSSPSTPQTEYAYRNGELLITARTTTRTNVALSATGAVASASAVASSAFPASAANDGDRQGRHWGAGGGWLDNSYQSYPDWLEVDFNGTKTIDEVDVFSIQDAYATPSEPTETMTFSLYGLTGFEVQYWTGTSSFLNFTWLTWSSFEVQYWTGTSWADVPNGNVSGNNLVWRKLTFASLTTSKIRVLTNAAVDGWSRLAEVEAWAETAGSADVRWVVADQLGTPRMIADKSGSLAGMSRHDYLPFGEEVSAGTGGRTTGQGYVVDSVEQKFTGKIRDGESGLDYFGARYYASSQGRFTSIDPLLASAHAANPQTWNRYSYADNDPLNNIDPTGMAAISVDDTKVDHQGKVQRVNPVTGRPGINPTPQNGEIGRIRSNSNNPKVGNWGYSRTDKNGNAKFHPGADINAPIGTPVVAAEGGRVTAQGNFNKDCGNRLTITTKSGDTEIYCHLSGFAENVNNTIVATGQVVGFSGNSGNATGLTQTNEDHLHFGIILAGDTGTSDPVKWINEGANVEPQGPPQVNLPQTENGTIIVIVPPAPKKP